MSDPDETPEDAFAGIPGGKHSRFSGATVRSIRSPTRKSA